MAIYRRSDDLIGKNCICGSLKLTENCCARSEGVLFKKSLIIKENKNSHSHYNKKCLFRHRLNCSPKISREHYISQSVLRLLNSSGIKTLKVQGIAGHADFKSIAIKNITAKILCKTHNEMFSKLDREIARFARAIQSHFEMGDDQEYLFNGHDIERWLFKVSIGMYYGKIIKEDFDERFLRTPSFLDCMIAPVIKNNVGGLYATDLKNTTIFDYVEFSISSIRFAHTNKFCGIKYSFFGVPLALIFHGDSRVEQATQNENFQFRPSQLVLKGKYRVTRIWLSWHGDFMGSGVQYI